MKDKRVLIVAQTPPPFHGQAIMQKYIVEANWPWCKKDFERMNFSEEINEVGTFKTKKISQLIDLIRRIRRKARPRFDLIYYPPGGPNRVPIYRDVIMLFFLKRFSHKIVLHFHAGGVDQIFNKVSKAEAYIIKKAFHKIDAVVVLTDWLKKEVEWCSPKKIFVVGNGIEDVFDAYTGLPKPGGDLSFLFIGNLKKEKGIYTLVNAAAILKRLNIKFHIKFIGSFHSTQEEQTFLSLIEENELGGFIKYLGPKSGKDKWAEFATSDIFCLPTYETEAMPISILEGMMFQLPVITTRWRSIPDLIRHGENGLLFEPDNAQELADCMKRLINDAEERQRMGIQSRKDYLQSFTVERHLKKMQQVVQDVLNN